MCKECKKVEEAGRTAVEEESQKYGIVVRDGEVKRVENKKE